MTMTAAPFRLEGSSVLLLGATGTMGRHLATELRSRGACLTLTGLDSEPLSDLAAQVSGSAALLADLRDADAGARLVEAAISYAGHLDAVVNAAGISMSGELVDTDPAAMEDVFLVNTLGPLWVIAAAVPALSSRGGVVCNVGSAVGPGEEAAVVRASRAALSTAMAALAQELGPRSISVIEAGASASQCEGLDEMSIGRVAARIVDAMAQRTPLS